MIHLEFEPFPDGDVDTSSCRTLPRAEEDEGLDDAEFLALFLSAVGLVLMAGLMSGLTLGLMSLDDVELEVLRRSGNSRQRACAERIRPVISNPHRLLVTLLVCNAIAAEALPLVLDRLTDPITAVIISVTVVLLFGEIIPQAACSTYGLEIGAIAAPFVRVLMFVTFPVNLPIGWVLDRVLGHRQTALFRRGQLKALVDIHSQGQEFGGKLSSDEVKIIKGALDLTNKTAKFAMTPLDLVFMVPMDAVLDEPTLTSILASGHSRVPVHRPGNRAEILGIILVKELIMIDPKAGIKVSSIKVRSLPHLLADTPMYDMLKLFELGRSHMAVLTHPTHEALVARREAEDRLAIDVYSISDELSDGPEHRSGDEEAPSPPPELSTSLSMRASEFFFGKFASGAVGGNSSTESEDGSDQPALDIFSLNFAPHEVVAVGIITIEDVIEELLGSEIVDETDRYVDNMHEERVNAALMARSLPPHLRKALASWLVTPRVGPAAQVYRMGRPLGSGRGPSATSYGPPYSNAPGGGAPPAAPSAQDGQQGSLYSRIPRVLHPPNLNPNSMAAQLGISTLPRTPQRAQAGDRRPTSVRQSVQNQLDMLQPLLDARAQRFTTPEDGEGAAGASGLMRQNSV